jgi:hydroxylaminobenzene mutase
MRKDIIPSVFGYEVRRLQLMRLKESRMMTQVQQMETTPTETITTIYATRVYNPHYFPHYRIGDTMEDSKRRLIWHGMFLFLLGLLTGFMETKFTNLRMGLAAHLEGVMNGTFLVALGAVWMEVRLPLKLKAVAYWSALYGAYVNWVATALGAALGAAALSPITGAGHSALPWQETLMTALFMSVGLAIVGSSVLVLWGLRRSAAAVVLPAAALAETKRASG